MYADDDDVGPHPGCTSKTVEILVKARPSTLSEIEEGVHMCVGRTTLEERTASCDHGSSSLCSCGIFDPEGNLHFEVGPFDGLYLQPGNTNKGAVDVETRSEAGKRDEDASPTKCSGVALAEKVLARILHSDAAPVRSRGRRTPCVEHFLGGTNDPAFRDENSGVPQREHVLLAYGQTGSGKSHTLFGAQAVGLSGLVAALADQSPARDNFVSARPVSPRSATFRKDSQKAAEALADKLDHFMKRVISLARTRSAAERNHDLRRSSSLAHGPPSIPSLGDVLGAQEAAQFSIPSSASADAQGLLQHIAASLLNPETSNKVPDRGGDRSASDPTRAIGASNGWSPTGACLSFEFLELYLDNLHILIPPCRAFDLTEVESLAIAGFCQRVLRPTADNENSSRSHAIVTLRREEDPAGGQKGATKVTLIDLAGSERVVSTNRSRKQMIETQFINRSLQSLRRVITALGDRDVGAGSRTGVGLGAHVPWRDSKLTQLLRPRRGSCPLFTILVTLSPHCPRESIESLRFAESCRQIRFLDQHSRSTMGEVPGTPLASSSRARYSSSFNRFGTLHRTPTCGSSATAGTGTHTSCSESARTSFISRPSGRLGFGQSEIGAHGSPQRPRSPAARKCTRDFYPSTSSGRVESEIRLLRQRLASTSRKVMQLELANEALRSQLDGKKNDEPSLTSTIARDGAGKGRQDQPSPSPPVVSEAMPPVRSQKEGQIAVAEPLLEGNVATSYSIWSGEQVLRPGSSPDNRPLLSPAAPPMPPRPGSSAGTFFGRGGFGRARGDVFNKVDHFPLPNERGQQQCESVASTTASSTRSSSKESSISFAERVLATDQAQPQAVPGFVSDTVPHDAEATSAAGKLCEERQAVERGGGPNHFCNARRPPASGAGTKLASSKTPRKMRFRFASVGRPLFGAAADHDVDLFTDTGASAKQSQGLSPTTGAPARHLHRASSSPRVLSHSPRATATGRSPLQDRQQRMARSPSPCNHQRVKKGIAASPFACTSSPRKTPPTFANNKGIKSSRSGSSAGRSSNDRKNHDSCSPPSRSNKRVDFWSRTRRTPSKSTLLSQQLATTSVAAVRTNTRLLCELNVAAERFRDTGVLCGPGAVGQSVTLQREKSSDTEIKKTCIFAAAPASNSKNPLHLRTTVENTLLAFNVDVESFAAGAATPLGSSVDAEKNEQRQEAGIIEKSALGIVDEEDEERTQNSEDTSGDHGLVQPRPAIGNNYTGVAVAEPPPLAAVDREDELRDAMVQEELHPAALEMVSKNHSEHRGNADPSVSCSAEQSRVEPGDVKKPVIISNLAGAGAGAGAGVVLNAPRNSSLLQAGTATTRPGSAVKVVRTQFWKKFLQHDDSEDAVGSLTHLQNLQSQVGNSK
ncbi:unnamed protein product [Amoebophrya sp. A120]|nr:unnamed protein product [Amoebophrya sp. A120]|eukprot:GSA120T00021601001.1